MIKFFLFLSFILLSFHKLTAQQQRTFIEEGDKFIDTLLVDSSYVPNNSILFDLIKRNRIRIMSFEETHSYAGLYYYFSTSTSEHIFDSLKVALSFGYVPINPTVGDTFYLNGQKFAYESCFFIYEYYFNNKKNPKAALKGIKNYRKHLQYMFFSMDIPIYWFVILENNRVFFVLSFADKNDSPNMILLKKEIKRIVRKQRWQRIIGIDDK